MVSKEGEWTWGSEHSWEVRSLSFKANWLNRGVQWCSTSQLASRQVGKSRWKGPTKVCNLQGPQQVVGQPQPRVNGPRSEGIQSPCVLSGLSGRAPGRSLLWLLEGVSWQLRWWDTSPVMSSWVWVRSFPLSHCNQLLGPVPTTSPTAPRIISISHPCSWSTGMCHAWS